MTTIGTVVIPAYGMASMVERALDSVAEAIAFHRRVPFVRHGDIRIVVVDDASPDDSADRAIAWGRRHPELEVIAVRSAQNRGVSFARNLGVDAAEGDFLWFLDADDEYLPPHFAAGILALDHTPAAGCFVSGIELEADIHPDWRTPIESSTVFNICVRRVCHDYIGGFLEDECFRAGAEDVAYRYMLEAAFVVMGSDITTVRYRRRPGNALDRQLPRFRRSYAERASFGDHAADPVTAARIVQAVKEVAARTDGLSNGPPRRTPQAPRETATFAGTRFFDQYVRT